MKKEIRPTTAVVPCPVILLSVAGSDRPNIITLSWVANVCSKPPSVAVGIRPQRHSHALVKETGDFVLNVPLKDHLETAQFCGSMSGRDYDKFIECGLTPMEASKVKSPLIKECPINLECKTTQVVSPGVHDLFIAEVLTVHIDESVIDDKNRFLAADGLFTYLPLIGEYWSLGENIE